MDSKITKLLNFIASHGFDAYAENGNIYIFIPAYHESGSWHLEKIACDPTAFSVKVALGY